MTKHFLYPLLIAVITSITTFAQTEKIVGKVVDATNQSLVGANVMLLSTSQGAATDNQGNFIISNVKQGNYKIQVSYIGFQKVIKNIEVKPNRTTQVNFKLKAGIINNKVVCVVGERLKGQAKALNQQRNNSNISNVIEADQIGRFPDANIGDAIKRIPAINVQYDQGEARFASIRGTAPALNSFTINGERIPSAEAEVRNVQLDLIPSDMIQTIEVNKALTPQMDADAIGGSVNFVTRSAPNNLRLSVTTASGYSAIESKPIWTGGLVLGNRFFNDKLGIMLSGSYNNIDYGSHNAEGKWKFDDNNNPYVTQWDIRRYLVQRIRKSISLDLDYKIDPLNTIFLKTIFNKRDDYENRFRLRYKKLGEPDADGMTKAEVRRQTKGGSANNNNRRLEDQQTYKIALSGKHNFNDLLKVNWSASYSAASEERPNERYISWRAKKIPVKVDISNQTTPYFSTENIYDKLSVKEISEEHKFTDESKKVLKLNLKLPLIKNGKFKNELRIGGKYKAKSKERDNNFYEYELTTNGETKFANFNNIENKDYTVANFLAGNYTSGKFTSESALGNFDFNQKDLFESKSVKAEYAAKNYTAEENISAGYVQLNQKYGKNLLFIIGVRLENTASSNKGYQYNESDDSVIPIENSDNYLNILPGVHIKYDINNNSILRFAWTNTLARPNYYDLVPYRAISSDYEELSIGNSTLKPTTAMNLDLMAEHYFSGIGIISAGLFYKNINDFIITKHISDYTDPTTGKLFSDFYQPINGAKATLYGVEVGVQRQLDFLGDWGRSLGIYLNYTYNYSVADNPVLAEQTNSDKTIPLPGTAPHTINVAFNYSTPKVDLGVAFNYSSAYLDPDELNLTPGLERYYDEVTYLDFNGSYAITEQIRFFVDAKNLLNQPLRYYAGIKERTYQQEFYSWNMNFGVKYDF